MWEFAAELWKGGQGQEADDGLEEVQVERPELDHNRKQNMRECRISE